MKKYPSKYSNGKLVSAAQYITELICEKKAKKDKKDLHYRFWITKEWSTYYRNQIASAYVLLKQYDDVAIIRALNNPQSEKIYSLRAPFLVPIIEKEALILKNQNQNLSIHLERKDNIKYNRNTKNSSNIVSKLRKLEE